MTKAVVDWFDERLGVREFYANHIKYPIPEYASFWSLFGGLAIGCIAIQFFTGFYMLFYYLPEPDLAHQSIRDMCNNTMFGAIFRNVHRWSATVAILFILIHMVHVVAKRAYKAPRELNWWTGLLLGFVFILFLVTGIIMPWDWRSYWELIIWADWLATIPIIGDMLKDPFLQWFTLGRNFALHAFLLPVIIGSLLFVHLLLFRRLGMSKNV